MREERTPRRAQQQPVAEIEVVARGTRQERHGKAVTKTLKRVVLLSILCRLALVARARVDRRALTRTPRSGGVKGDSP